MVSGVCVYRCQEKAHHWLFPTLTAKGQVQYVYTTRGLAQMMRDGKQLISDWKAAGSKMFQMLSGPMHFMLVLVLKKQYGLQVIFLDTYIDTYTHAPTHTHTGHAYKII